MLQGKLRRSSLKAKLLVSFVIVLILPSIVIGWTSYQQAKTNFNETILQSAEDNVKILNNVINKEIDSKKVDAVYFTKLFNGVSYGTDQLQNVQNKLEEYNKLHPEIEAIYTGSSTGQFIQSPSIQMPDGYNPTERDWYKEAAKKSGEVVITAPYKSSTTGNIVITIAKQNEDKSGVLGIDLIINDIVNTSKMVNIGKTGFVAIFDQSKHVIAHPTMKPGDKIEEKVEKELYKQETGDFKFKLDGDDRNITFITNKQTGWKIAGIMPSKEIIEAANPIFYKTLTVIGISLIIGGVLIYFIIASIISPLKQLVISSKKISEGDLTETITVHSKDEIGQLGESFNEMAASLHHVISNINTSASHVAASSEELTASMKQTSEATEQITQAIEQVSSGAEIQTKEVEEGATLLEEVTEGIQRVADSSSLVSTASMYTKKKAEDGGKLVEQTVNQMQLIHESVSQSDKVIVLLDDKSKQIGAILEVIQHIAEQTNLLALNAAIEAARAGEQGRGFAIVADEVRKLAEQSGQSSTEIGKLVKEIQFDIKETVSSMKLVGTEVQSGLVVANETKQSFAEILKSTDDTVVQIDNMVDVAKQMTVDARQVSASINEIAATIEENAASVQNIAGSSEEQLASVDEINAAAVHLSQMAEELQEMIGKFKV
ncbi:methyl-accepting chemotaxis protein [Bacillus anthracis]|nr:MULTISPECIES: methyl-accepting chemotaxis protein [Bacillus cereus group]COE51280.1 histidine kinase [Streptococcus pneumoniae]ARZ60841.1 chemotaxis protein [Bacillus thuringiensis]EEM73310.1 Methyl-accepting chemotaxis protein [Bacillus thuringiensis serovar andalousiensis BGSC 4AW1]MBL3852913.1 methyl-accepting chemotaxis protein [Bacillus cereus]MCC0771989.1 methyl-accepting chemotaxis protein [Bacillus pacificus]